MNDLKFSICIPTYNAANLLKQTIESIFRQSFKNYEIIVSDDCSTDNTKETINSFKDNRIRYFKNENNLGYGNNLRICCSKADGDIIYLMGHDDILLKDALLKTYNAFMKSDEVGVVTRPYYWFCDNVRTPVRAVMPYNAEKDSIISIFDGEKEVNAIFESVGQLSGLGYRKKYIDIPFHEEIFPAHIYPFASILKKYKAVYLKDFIVAVRIESSMTRHKSSIYELSPTESWMKMFKTVYSGKRYAYPRGMGIKHMATNYEGLIQLKNYSTLWILIREILILIKYRWQNIFNLKFWFFSLGALILPRKLLIWMTDNYKRKILSGQLKDIKIEI